MGAAPMRIRWCIKREGRRLGDSAGLFLLVQPSGGKLWRLKYRLDQREKKLGIGTYPEVRLAEARSPRFYSVRATSLDREPGDLGKGDDSPPEDAPVAPAQWPMDAAPDGPDPDDCFYGADDLDPFGY